MRTIELLHTKIVIVDDEDFDKIVAHRWYIKRAPNTTYAMAIINGIKTLMHSYILNISDGRMIDHKDRNGLNNTKGNLRFCNHSQNGINRPAMPNSSCVYKGVMYRQDGSWMAQIKVRGETINLGSYVSPDIAAHAHDIKALAEFGEFAYLNFPDNIIPQDIITRFRKRHGDYQKIKTHCANGHLYDDKNTVYTKKGYRQCRICLNIYALRYHRKNKGLI